MTQKAFEPIHLPKKQPVESITGYYRVYKNAKEFVRVQASTADEALKTSGVTGSCKVEPDSLDSQPVLKSVPEKEEVSTPPAPPKTEEGGTPPAAPAQSQP